MLISSLTDSAWMNGIAIKQSLQARIKEGCFFSGLNPSITLDAERSGREQNVLKTSVAKLYSHKKDPHTKIKPHRI